MQVMQVGDRDSPMSLALEDVAYLHRQCKENRRDARRDERIVSGSRPRLMCCSRKVVTDVETKKDGVFFTLFLPKDDPSTLDIKTYVIELIPVSDVVIVVYWSECMACIDSSWMRAFTSKSGVAPPGYEADDESRVLGSPVLQDDSTWGFCARIMVSETHVDDVIHFLRSKYLRFELIQTSDDIVEMIPRKTLDIFL